MSRFSKSLQVIHMDYYSLQGVRYRSPSSSSGADAEIFASPLRTTRDGFEGVCGVNLPGWLSLVQVLSPALIASSTLKLQCSPRGCAEHQPSRELLRRFHSFDGDDARKTDRHFHNGDGFIPASVLDYDGSQRKIWAQELVFVVICWC
ncbi:uncharacterized protein BO97DRAFT_275336 [Aspergillus homomorphus CBS 101889]|uniref:Uncharacterized protein n=1 Tax=Aspergillus homomorphus (strain CBS 101889) TaxID=1450537 RepID=A0A395I4K8_ASPHC|nr:hypothetical protein BO97DRAFT_275336 [Aspergillus homomorphus CBS 101889]RAL14705.1 hypothetical protein BO97DRAFT_275336 [Aspergillus homomorphus CBS 101889]